MRTSPETIDEFPFHVEVWSLDDMRVDQTMAVAKHIGLARAAYEECLKAREGRIVRLRNGARVVDEFKPGS
ncbi:MAG: hypothetical protein EOR04_05235 [Mesorhizobium sp.]|uniref:hypothetical protein n=1 Tax=Mesorhizobium sp. TaxID=1871066 RepID=UPI000FE6DD43|nr:hypothetical protein [Mesorhizobium sp.]RWP44327.1 MAG: hypothetical protein EOR04_05235 [Mesorhizobium sp.]